MKRHTHLAFFLLFLLILPFSVSALVEYKPYLHKANVPEHPKLTLSGISQIELFTGTEKFTYPIIVPEGTNGVQPPVELMYESSKTAERQSLLGTGWSLNDNYIITNVNSTVGNASDDLYELFLNGVKYELVYVPSENRFHTKQEQFFFIQNLTGASNGDATGRYWLLRTKDGTQYRFGFNADSTMLNNKISGLVWRWSLDLINDTHNNQIFYSYGENIFPADQSAVYLTKIEYNNDKKRVVNFFYETSNRPDLWMQYDNGALVNESRRLKEIFITADSSLVRRYVLEYVQLNSTSRSSLANITIFGSDNSTTLPPVKFSYRSPSPGWEASSVWNPPTSMNFVDSTNEDTGVRFADLNRDGYQDIIKIQAGGSNQRWLSNGNGWQNTTLWDTTGLPDFVLSNGQDNGTRIEDINNDGLPDIINARGTARTTYLNTGTGWVQDNTWNLSEGMGFVDVAVGRDLGVRLVDLNADGWVDAVKATTANRTVFLNNGKNTPATPWVVSDAWLVPVDAVFVVDGTSKDLGVRFADVNADGYVDLLKGNTTHVKTWLNNGNGWTEDPLWNVPGAAGFANTTAEDNGVRIVDVNGDRLPDLMQGFDTNLNTWLNNGSGWTLNNSWATPLTFVDSSGRNKGVRVVDVNGDELPDVLKHDANLSVIAAYIDLASQGYLLDKVTFDFGGTENFGYRSSTLFNESGTLVDAMNFNLWLVTNVTRHNNMTAAHLQHYNRTYNYSYGVFDFRNRQFRGFGFVEERRNETLWRYWYHQDDARSGKEIAVAVFNRTNTLLYQNTSYDWTVRNQNGYNITLLAAQKIDSFDGTASRRSVNSSFSYDVYGNTVEVNNSGEMGVSGDESYQKFVYVNNTAVWIVNALENHSVYGFTPTVLMKRTLYLYDNNILSGVPTKGDITRKEEWSNSSADMVSYYGYDSYGNVIQYNDSLNRTMNYTFGVRDTTFTFVDRVENPKGQRTNYVYNLGFGTVLNVTDSNTIETNYTYDVFARIQKEIQPFDSSTYPTKEYSYSIDGIAPERIMVATREQSSTTNTLNTSYYYDGFGNLIQVKTEAENSSLQIAGDIYYDSLDRPIKTSNPYYVTFSGDYTTPNASVVGMNYTYDPLDRVVQVLNPDNTRIQINFTLWNVTTLDERGKRKDYILDGNGNIIRVVEFYNNGTNIITYNTTYRYDALNQLTQINDSKANMFNFTYDSLGRTIQLQDPDLRTWNYTYDSVSNLLAQEGAGGELTSDGDYYREYNALHQLIRVRQKTSTGKILEEYWYDANSDRIMTVRVENGQNTTIYTPFREWMMIVNSTGSYNYTYVYDGNTLIARINPNGSKYFYHDDHLGSTSLITDQNGNIVEETFYYPFGQNTQGGVQEAYLLYTNQFKDAIGCYDYGARVYCPKWYHFTTADLMIQNKYMPQYLNRYSYVRNNPYKYVDPDGKNARIYLDREGGAGFGHYAIGVDNPENPGTEIFYENEGISNNYNLIVGGSTIHIFNSGSSTLRQTLSFSGLFAAKTYSREREFKDENGNIIYPNEDYGEYIEIVQGQEIDKKMVGEGNKLVESPWAYVAGAHDSEDFAIAILEAGGYKINEALYPKNTFDKELKNKFGSESTSSVSYTSYTITSYGSGSGRAAEGNNPNKSPSPTKQTSTQWKKKGGKKK